MCETFIKNGWLRLQKEKIAKNIISKLNKDTSYLLDLGCGPGFYTHYLRKSCYIYVGVDKQKNEEWKKIKNKRIFFVVGDAEKLPFRSESLDCIILEDILHHVNHKEKVINELFNILKKRGKIIVIEANKKNLVMNYYWYYFHHHHFYIQEIEKLFRNFKVVSKNYIESYPFYCISLRPQLLPFTFSFLSIRLLAQVTFFRKILLLIQKMIESNEIINKYSSFNLLCLEKLEEVR